MTSRRTNQGSDRGHCVRASDATIKRIILLTWSRVNKDTLIFLGDGLVTCIPSSLWTSVCWCLPAGFCFWSLHNRKNYSFAHSPEHPSSVLASRPFLQTSAGLVSSQMSRARIVAGTWSCREAWEHDRWGPVWWHGGIDVISPVSVFSDSGCDILVFCSAFHLYRKLLWRAL